MNGEERSEELPDLAEKELTPERIKIIESRFKQRRDSRLAEYITGIRLDHEDPEIAQKRAQEMAKRLVDDQKIIRTKYSLPSHKSTGENPTDYERLLKEGAKKMGVAVRDTSEFQAFFEKHRAKGVHFEKERTVVASIDKRTLRDYMGSLGILEHEFIHADQFAKSPGMPIELKEYEAYIAGLNTGRVEKDSQDAKNYDNVRLVFGYLINASVSMHYKEENDNRPDGEPEIEPVWDNAEYFLEHIDKIEPWLIEAYKLRQVANM